jgi:glucosylceramidase
MRPGARRISAVSNRSGLRTTAFKNPDGTLAVMIMNGGSEPVRFRLRIVIDEVDLVIPARAIQTVTG